jgi:hydroxymethylbilane synthase
MSYLGRPLRIGTRGSPLALVQAHYVREQLCNCHKALSEHDAIEIVPIQTTGDKIKDKTLSEIGGKGLFTKEIDLALLSSNVDIAVHSMKDMPTVLPNGIVIGCLLPREDPRDALITRNGEMYADLPSDAVIGTASLRRSAQVLASRPDLRVVSLRGNVDTRLAKLSSGAVDATLLAVAGLKRLGRADVITTILPVNEMMPAVAQGAIGAACRSRDDYVLEILRPLNHANTVFSITAERAFLAHLDGSCQTPIGALAKMDDVGRITLSGLLAARDGSKLVKGSRSGESSSAAEIGHSLAIQLLAEAGPNFLLPIR